jgi:hypothetical protein
MFFFSQSYFDGFCKNETRSHIEAGDVSAHDEDAENAPLVRYRTPAEQSCWQSALFHHGTIFRRIKR